MTAAGPAEALLPGPAAPSRRAGLSPEDMATAARPIFKSFSAYRANSLIESAD